MNYLKSLSVPVLLTITLAPLAYLAAKPDKSTPKKSDIPVLIASCQFGKLMQDSRTFTISGNEAWVADGEISKDGKTAKLTWVRFPEGRIAIGVYAIIGGEMKGFWQWDGEVEYNLEGGIANGNAEHLRKD